MTTTSSTSDFTTSASPAVGGLALSADNGVSDNDFVTNVALQTVRATLSAALATGDTVWGSVDGGDNWIDITFSVDGTALAWQVVLPAAGTLAIRVVDADGLAGAPASHAFTIDMAAPGQTIVAPRFSADSGIAGDFITNVAPQTLSGSLSAPLADGEFVEVSFNGGFNWIKAPSANLGWALSGITLGGFGELQARVSDQAGNHGATWSHSWRHDATAPMASTPQRADMVDPQGSGFTFSVTYADGGAGIDAATIGPGNVSVSGPGGPLSVTGATMSGNTVTYTVAAPGGSWDPGDAGSYTIGINGGAGAVADLAGNRVSARPEAHVFTVGVNSAPLLGGVFSSEQIGDDASATPFAGVTLQDADGDSLTLTIGYAAANGVLSGAGLSGTAGSYMLGGSAAAVQAALRALVFTPTANQVAFGTVATIFTLEASDGRAFSVNSATVVGVAPVAPTASITLSDTALSAGETATLTVTFSEAVTGFTAADLQLPGGTLGQLGTRDGGRTWSATFTPDTDVASGAAPYQVLLDLSGVRDAGGLAGSGTFAGPAYTIDTVRPSATLHLDDSVLTGAETATLRIVFSQAVTGFDAADLVVANGSISGLSSQDGITWTATFTPKPGAWADANQVRLDLAGVTGANGNAGLGVALSDPYAVHTGTPPGGNPEPEPPPVPTPGGMVDGVRVVTGREVDPVTGLASRTVAVPIVGAGRIEDPDTLNAGLADIPLSVAGSGMRSTIGVGLPVGAGLQASTSSGLLQGEGALLDLLRRIELNTQDGAARQAMADAGAGFVRALDTSPLQTATLALRTGAAGAASEIVVTGNAAVALPATAIVLDAGGLAPGSVVRLDHVDFAAVIGALTLRGGAGDNHVIGDDASQHIATGEGDDVLSGGGGDDVLQGGRSVVGAWQFTLSARGVLGAVHDNAAAGGRESLALAGLAQGEAELAFLAAPHETLAEMALLYRAAFGRAPDVDGLNFYLGHDAGAQVVARNFMASAEWDAGGMNALSDAAFVARLYQQVLGRAPDGGGEAFWNSQLASGAATRADVLLGFALSEEHRAAQGADLVIAATDVQDENGWIAGSGDDRLEGGAGSDRLVGGDGVDTVVYGGQLTNYRILLGKDGAILVADKASADVDTLLGIERGEFAGAVTDLEFTQAAALKELGLLYQAVFDRAADVDGLNWWAGTGLQGAGLVAGFLDGAEFEARYGAMSDAAFVAALYANSGLEAGAAGGSAAWVTMLANHTRAELVGSWIGHDAVLDAQFAAQGLWLV